MVAPEPGDETDGDAPLGELADRVRSRRPPREDAPGSSRDAPAPGTGESFRTETYQPVATDDLWTTIESDASPETAVTPGDEPDEHVVPKETYCERCEHFSAPPTAACTHPGTAIVEFADADHVRVRNCPVVDQRRADGEPDRPQEPGSFGRR